MNLTNLCEKTMKKKLLSLTKTFEQITDLILPLANEDRDWIEENKENIIRHIGERRYAVLLREWSRGVTAFDSTEPLENLFTYISKEEHFSPSSRRSARLENKVKVDRRTEASLLKLLQSDNREIFGIEVKAISEDHYLIWGLYMEHYNEDYGESVRAYVVEETNRGFDIVFTSPGLGKVSTYFTRLTGQRV